MSVKVFSASQVVRTTAIPVLAVLKVENILQWHEKLRGILKVIIENRTDN